MAVSNRTTNTTSAADRRRAGGLAALKALQKIDDLGQYRDSDAGMRARQYLGVRALAIRTLVRAADGDPDYLRGVLEALGEFAWFVATVGEPNYDVWRPESAMTSEELRHARDELYAMDHDAEPQSIREAHHG